MTEATTTARGWPDHLHRMLPFAAPALVLLAIVVPFLRIHEYSLLLPESLILIGAAAVLGVVVGAVGGVRPATLGPMLIVLTICVYACFQQDVVDAVIRTANAASDVTGFPVVALTVLCLVLFLAICLICFLLRRHLNLIVATVFLTITLSSLPFGFGEPVQTGAIPENRKALPPVIHIILDEHIGLAGLPAGFASSEIVRSVIPATYKDFAIHDHAYSRFAETKFSLTSLMNRDLGVEVADWLEGKLFKFTPEQNLWFDRLKQQGYAIKVYQSAWFDMCGQSSAVDACYSYSFFSPNAIQRSSLSTGQRLRALATKLFGGRGALELEPLVGMEALDRLRSDIAEAPRGVAYVAHLLISHSGYLYAADCSLLDPSLWERETYGSDLLYTPEERDLLYRRYLDQLVCADKQMASLFDHLKAIGIYDEATIIVHGDHGSRIGEHHYVSDAPENLSRQDMIDHYSTHLAIKSPGITPGIYSEPVVLQRLFAETFLGGGLKTSPKPEEVFIRRTENGGFAMLQFPWHRTADSVAFRPSIDPVTRTSGTFRP